MSAVYFRFQPKHANCCTCGPTLAAPEMLEPCSACTPGCARGAQDLHTQADVNRPRANVNRSREQSKRRRVPVPGCSMFSVSGARLNGSVSSLSRCRWSEGEQPKQSKTTPHGVERARRRHAQQHLDHGVIHYVAAAWQTNGLVHESAHDGV